jgi:ankyrin repeat protein
MFSYSLVNCVEKGYLYGIQALMATGESLKQVTYAKNGTLIHKACVEGRLMRAVYPSWTPVVSERKVPEPRSFYSEMDSPVIVSMLLDNGVNVNARDRLGNTPLMVAVMGKRTRIIKLLVSRGADWTLENKKGKNASELAPTKKIRQWLEDCIAISQRNEFYLQWMTGIDSEKGVLHVLPEHIINDVCDYVANF